VGAFPHFKFKNITQYKQFLLIEVKIHTYSLQWNMLSSITLFHTLFDFRRSEDMVHLEVHRPPQPLFPASTTIPMPVKGGNSDSDDNSVQDFTIFDDRTALLHQSSVRFNPFKVLGQLRTKSCFGWSLSRPVRL